MGFGGLVYHGLDERVFLLLCVCHGIETVRIVILCLGDYFYGVFLRLLTDIDGIAVDVIAGYLPIGIRIWLALAAAGCLPIILGNIPCHLPAPLLDLAHLLLKLLHFPLLTAVRCMTVIAVVILVDVHPRLP